MKIKTSDLIGPALDWAVETIEIQRMRDEGQYIKEWWVKQKQSDPSPYSTDWLLAGPIIEREGIHVATLADGIDPLVHQHYKNGDTWEAEKMMDSEDSIVFTGPALLIAAMRCYVASKLGDVIDVPGGLV